VESPVSASRGKDSTSIPSSIDSCDSHPELLSDPLSDLSVAALSETDDGGPGGGVVEMSGMGADAMAAIL
jgi:hypothetical protein